MRKSAVVSVGLEDGVVPKALVAGADGDDGTGGHPVKLVPLAVQQQANRGAETGAAVCLACQTSQHFIHVGFRVFGGAGITGAQNARFTAKCGDLQASVVRKTIQIVMLAYIVGLQKGVAFEGVCGFWNVHIAADLSEGFDLEFGAELAADFGHLVWVVGGKYQGLHQNVWRLILPVSVRENSGRYSMDLGTSNGESRSRMSS